MNGHQTLFHVVIKRLTRRSQTFTFKALRGLLSVGNVCDADALALGRKNDTVTFMVSVLLRQDWHGAGQEVVTGRPGDVHTRLSD
ncbi:hypothetical protein NS381_18030 [Pantoea stewartii]|uniref:Uncharacterized protein n=1 Tax=Pantoea stewartii TaxID=66269 RepID=A0AB34VE14_9GAMM|nr:hypothetical protein NS381_18030 [Pantoea stewartii]KTS73682.1 hypothetical protein RSA30_10640 [Pantoea stewartii]KTS96518.1 hypothetical protein RSA13_12840 [Pantoea stewartii]KTT06344.1 hypothetical protein RSA36_17455 [Pantoea stewartii]